MSYKMLGKNRGSKTLHGSVGLGCRYRLKASTALYSPQTQKSKWLNGLGETFVLSEFSIIIRLKFKIVELALLDKDGKETRY